MAGYTQGRGELEEPQEGLHSQRCATVFEIPPLDIHSFGWPSVISLKPGTFRIFAICSEVEPWALLTSRWSVGEP